MITKYNDWGYEVSYIESGGETSVTLNKNNLLIPVNIDVCEGENEWSLSEFIALLTNDNLANCRVCLSGAGYDPTLSIRGFREPTQAEIDLFNDLAARYKVQERGKKEQAKAALAAREKAELERLKAKYE